MQPVNLKNPDHRSAVERFFFFWAGFPKANIVADSTLPPCFTRTAGETNSSDETERVPNLEISTQRGSWSETRVYWNLDMKDIRIALL